MCHRAPPLSLFCPSFFHLISSHLIYSFHWCSHLFSSHNTCLHTSLSVPPSLCLCSNLGVSHLVIVVSKSHFLDRNALVASCSAITCRIIRLSLTINWEKGGRPWTQPCWQLAPGQMFIHAQGFSHKPILRLLSPHNYKESKYSDHNLWHVYTINNKQTIYEIIIKISNLAI